MIRSSGPLSRGRSTISGWCGTMIPSFRLPQLTKTFLIEFDGMVRIVIFTFSGFGAGAADAGAVPGAGAAGVPGAGGAAGACAFTASPAHAIEPQTNNTASRRTRIGYSSPPPAGPAPPPAFASGLSGAGGGGPG